MGLANSLALKLAGISNNTLDPDGGAVVRNSIGGTFSNVAVIFLNQVN